MTLQEFSSEFDINYNNIMSNAAPGLTEYEKSVLLTEAQELVVVELYNGRDVTGTSFEQTEELREYLSALVTSTSKTSSDIIKDYPNPISPDSKVFGINDLLFILYESMTIDSPYPCLSGKEIPVVPVTLDEYYRVSKNPFRGAGERRALRLNAADKIEIVTPYDISKYYVRYLRKPKPIILESLQSMNLTINRVSSASECELNSALHRPILYRAVSLAQEMMYQKKG